MELPAETRVWPGQNESAACNTKKKYKNIVINSQDGNGRNTKNAAQGSTSYNLSQNCRSLEMEKVINIEEVQRGHKQTS